MFTTIDQSEDNWCTIDIDDETKLHCEDGTTRDLTSADIMCTRGKYEGYKLSEINDLTYMQWVQGANLDDHYIQQICRLRIKELK